MQRDKLERAEARIRAFLDRHGLHVVAGGQYARTFEQMVANAEARLLARPLPGYDRSDALALLELVLVDADPSRDRDVLAMMSWLYAQVGLFGLLGADSH